MQNVVAESRTANAGRLRLRLASSARMRRSTSAVPVFALTLACSAPTLSPERHVIRVNQLGYLPEYPKVAVLCSLDTAHITTFTIENENGRRVLGPLAASPDRPFGPCASTYRLDFSSLRAEGRYRLTAAGVRSPPVRISASSVRWRGRLAAHLHATAALRLQSVLSRFSARKDALLVDHPSRDGRVRPGHRRLGRCGRLSPVRDDVGERDLRDAHGVPRSA